MSPEFEEICGGRINFINYTTPLVRHSIYESFVVIKCIGNTFILPRKGLEVEISDGITSSGVKYKSSNYIGSEFRLWTKNKTKVIEILENDA